MASSPPPPSQTIVPLQRPCGPQLHAQTAWIGRRLHAKQAGTNRFPVAGVKVTVAALNDSASISLKLSLVCCLVLRFISKIMSDLSDRSKILHLQVVCFAANYLTSVMNHWRVTIHRHSTTSYLTTGKQGSPGPSLCISSIPTYPPPCHHVYERTVAPSVPPTARGRWLPRYRRGADRPGHIPV